MVVSTSIRLGSVSVARVINAAVASASSALTSAVRSTLIAAGSVVAVGSGVGDAHADSGATPTNAAAR